MKSAFLPFDERLAIIDDVIKPGYAALGRAGLAAPGPSRRAHRHAPSRPSASRPRDELARG